ncbi:MAG: hypothetical protein GC151_06515 [Betaproteobacteria bacterium]|nr:hypothetical protein [Betaproteobacteria bacterium]
MTRACGNGDVQGEASPSRPVHRPLAESSEFAGISDDRPDVLLLLRVLSDCSHVRRLDGTQWDLLIRIARAAKLLGILAHRIDRAGLTGDIPEYARNHLTGALLSYQHNRRMLLHAVDGVERALRPARFPVLLLKGAAYVLQELDFAVGRTCNDLDILIPHADLAEAEGLLADAGWITEKPDAYDQHYYRRWAHELPPMQHAALAMELDVHHTILPPLGSARPVTSLLLRDAVPISGTRWSVLGSCDQVLHASAHLFQDSDCVGKLRDLVDIDQLLRTHASDRQFWVELLERARIHGLGRCLWYAIRFTTSWLGTPVPQGTLDALAQHRPTAIARAVMDASISRVMFPVHPDGRPGFADDLWGKALLARSVWLRFPVSVLLYHASSKMIRGMRRSRPAGS